MKLLSMVFSAFTFCILLIGTPTFAAYTAGTLGTLPQPITQDSVRAATDQSFKILTIKATELPQKVVQKTIYCYNYKWNRKELERLGCSTTHLDEMGIR